MSTRTGRGGPPRALIAVALTALLATTALQLLGASVAHAASGVGGVITRSEVIDRAEYWYARNVPYDQGATYPDPQGRRYRTDCSGFVSMAWHLDTSYTTAGFGSWSGKSYIAWSDLKPGDAILGVSYGHMTLFHRWDDASHTHVRVYEQANPASDMNYSTIPVAWYQDHGFRPIRYNKIIDDRGTDSIGYFNPSDGTFHLRNALNSGASDYAWGGLPANSGFVPLTGDWDGR